VPSGITLGLQTIVLSLPPITTTAGQQVKLDSMVNIELATDVFPYNYTIFYDLLANGSSIAQLLVEGQDDNADASPRRITEIPSMTWLHTPITSPTTYSIRITIVGGIILSASALTRALNATIF
jgi:hypothetical protein